MNKTLLAIALGAVLVGTVAVGIAFPEIGERLVGAAASSRTAPSAGATLALQGYSAVPVRSATGGHVYAEVLGDMDGGKVLGPARFAPLQATLDGNALRELASFLDRGVGPSPMAANSNLYLLDANGKVHTNRQLQDAWVTELTLPKLEAASKDTALFTVVLAPTSAADGATGGTAPSSKAGGKQTPGLAGNFRLNLAGLDASRVVAIEPLSVKRTMEPSTDAERRDSGVGPAAISTLKVTLTGAVTDWVAWHNDMVIKGKNTPSNEKSGSIELLNANMNTVLLRFPLTGVGISSIQPVHDPNGGAVRHVVELYVESVGVAAGP